MAAPGYEEKQRLLSAGFTAEEVAAWEQETAAKLRQGGFSTSEIEDYLGYGPPKVDSVKALVASDFMAQGEEPPLQEAKGFLQGLSAGYQGSITGMTKRQSLPDITLSEDANFIEVFGSAIGQMAGDLPVSLPAFFGGAKIGAPIGAAAGGATTRTPIGTAAGTVAGAGVGGGAVSGFVTGATREALINFYRENEGTHADARAFSSRLIAAVMDPSTLEQGGKEALVGALTGGVRVPVAGAVAGKTGSKVAAEVAVQSAEVTVGVTAAAALEGELPKPTDFAAAGALVAGFQVGGYAVRKANPAVRDATRRLQDHYVRTGERPEAAAERARRDPVFRQMIASGEGEPSAIDKTLREPGGTGERIVVNKGQVGEEAIAAAKAAETPHSAIVAAAQPSVETAKRSGTLADSQLPADRAVAQARTAIRNRIRPIDREGWSLKKTVDDLRYRYVNRLQHVVSPFETAYRNATGKRLSVEDNPGEMARLAYGAPAKADVAIKRGLFDAKGNKIGPALEEILKPVEKDIDAFVEYAVAKRVLEKHAQELDTGFDAVEADLLVKTYDKQFSKAFEQLQDWQNTQLADLKDSGLISADDFDKIVAQNQAYVPFARLLDDVAAAPKGTTARGLPVRKTTKAFKGSDKEVLDPLEVIVKNRYAVQQVIENNRARRRMVEDNNKLPEEFQFLSKAPKKLSVTTIAEGDTQLRKFLEENGLDIEDATGIHLYRAMSKNLANGDFIVFEEGKPVVYTAADPDFVKSLSAMERSSMGLLVKMLGVPSALLRSGVTINPEFVIKSSVRDQIAGVLQNDFLVVPFVDAARGLAGLVKRDKDFIRWMNSGGANASLLALDKNLLKVMTHKNTGNLYQDLVGNAWNAATAPARLAANISLLAENSMRLGRFKRAVREGKSDEVAALQGRDVSLDFARRGADLEALNVITAWQGAAINGIDRFHTAFTRAPAKTLAKTAALITLPSLVLWAMHKDEEWYKNLEDWEKAMFWHIPTGKKDENGDPIIMRYPMPHQFGPIFGYLPVKMFEAFSGENPDAAEAMTEAVRQTYSVPMSPVAVTPIMELGMNHSFFTGEPIVSRSQQEHLPAYRYTPYTTEASKRIAQTLAVMPGSPFENYATPIAIEHMVRGYSGSIGAELLRLASAGGEHVGALKNIERPEPQIADNPVYGAFFVRNSSAGKELSDFYENAEFLDQLRSTIRSEIKYSASEAEIDRILHRYGAPSLNPAKARKSIGTLRESAKIIYYNPDIPGDEKRQLINEIMKHQMAIAGAFNEQYEAYKEIEDGSD